MDKASKDALITSNEMADVFNYEFPEVVSDLSIFTSLEEEALRTEHLIGHHCEKGFVDSVLDFSTFCSQKCFNIESFPFAGDYEQIHNGSDLLHSDLTHGEEIKKEVLDARFKVGDDGVQGVKSLPAGDAKFAGQVFNLDSASCKESSFGGGFCETRLLRRYERESVADLSSAIVLMPDDASDQTSSMGDQLTGEVPDESLRKTFERETSIIENEWMKHQIFVGLDDHANFDCSLNITDCATAEENECKQMHSSSTGSSGIAAANGSNRPVKRKRLSRCDSPKTSMTEAAEVEIGSQDGGDKAGSLATEKRLRKPPKRYSEESFEHKFRSYNRKCGMPFRNSKEKVPLIKYHRHQQQKGFGEAYLDSQDESFKGGFIQVPFGLPIEEGDSASEKETLGYADIQVNNALVVCEEKIEGKTFSAESEDENVEDDAVIKNSKKGSCRRKHHISWTLSEVLKLIEGVSQYGVGRWTEIKKLQFSSSAHRTSVDLKDKWRNLLRASEAQLRSRRKVEVGRKQASHQVPESVLFRVRELADLYPYPRGSRSKHSCTTSADSTFPSATNALVSLSTVV